MISHAGVKRKDNDFIKSKSLFTYLHIYMYLVCMCVCKWKLVSYIICQWTMVIESSQLIIDNIHIHTPVVDVSPKQTLSVNNNKRNLHFDHRRKSVVLWTRFICSNFYLLFDVAYFSCEFRLAAQPLSQKCNVHQQ